MHSLRCLSVRFSIALIFMKISHLGTFKSNKYSTTVVLTELGNVKFDSLEGLSLTLVASFNGLTD
jgi:hypothetical protein